MVLKIVTSTLTANTFSQRSSFSRALSLLLLVFIVYGTTVEAAHRHGGIVTASNSVNTTSLANSGNSKALRLNLIGCGDCLICQLHQHFSTTLLSTRSGLAPARFRTEYSETASVASQSQINAPRTGRAPPRPSLFQ